MIYSQDDAGTGRQKEGLQNWKGNRELFASPGMMLPEHGAEECRVGMMGMTLWNQGIASWLS